jgi:spore maturation protein CgeB
VRSFWIPFGYDKLCVDSARISSKNFLFVGSYDKQRVEFVEKIGREDVKVYGNHEWSTHSSSQSIVRHCFQNKSLYGGELCQETARAAGTLNFLRPQNILEDSHNMRTFEIPAMGGLQLSWFTSEQAEFFEKDKEILFYGSIEELKDKMNFIIAHPEVGMKIKEQAILRCQKSKYSYQDRCSQMLSIMQEYSN